MDKKKSKQQDVLVIGAGASGMMTAITVPQDVDCPLPS